MKLSKSFFAIVAAVLMFTAAGASYVRAQQIVPPAGVGSIPVPAGHRPFLVLHARGVQTYTGTADGVWSAASVPQADLFKPNGLVVGTHFGGPTWQLRDGSMTRAAKVAGITKDPSAVAWLLLQAVSPMAGADGDRLEKTAYIHRVNTVGGVAPAGSATPGATVSVPYEADYYFYRAE